MGYRSRWYVILVMNYLSVASRCLCSFPAIWCKRKVLLTGYKPCIHLCMTLEADIRAERHSQRRRKQFQPSFQNESYPRFDRSLCIRYQMNRCSNYHQHPYLLTTPPAPTPLITCDSFSRSGGFHRFKSKSKYLFAYENLLFKNLTASINTTTTMPSTSTSVK